MFIFSREDLSSFHHRHLREEHEYFLCEREVLNCDFCTDDTFGVLTVFLAFHRLPMRGSLQALWKWRDMLGFTFSMHVSGTYRCTRMRRISQSFLESEFLLTQLLIHIESRRVWLCVKAFTCGYYLSVESSEVKREILISCLALKKQNQCCSLQMLFACVVYTDGHLWFLICSASLLISRTC